MWAAIVACILIAMPSLSMAQEEASGTDTQIVWAEKENGRFKVFYSRYENDTWSAKRFLSLPEQSSVYPAVGSGPDGTTWVVWTVLHGNESDLFFTRSSPEGGWTEPEQILTNLPSNSAAMVIVDRKNTPWVVWSGFDGNDDEIYFTRWNGSDWDIPLMINDDNATPDIIPSLTLNENGFPVVRWLGFGEDGYVTMAKEWSGFTWDETIVEKSADPFSAAIPESPCLLPELPDYVRNTEKAAIDFNCGRDRQSYRLGSMRRLKY